MLTTLSYPMEEIHVIQKIIQLHDLVIMMEDKTLLETFVCISPERKP